MPADGYDSPARTAPAARGRDESSTRPAGSTGSRMTADARGAGAPQPDPAFLPTGGSPSQTAIDGPRPLVPRFVAMAFTAIVALVVLHHCAAPYTGLGGWYYNQLYVDWGTAGMLGFVILNRVWFMSPLFLLAGYVTPLIFDRGVRPYLVDRALRLLVPLVVYMVALRPLVLLGAYSIAPDPKPNLFVYNLQTMETGVMWPVATILVFSAVYLGWRLVRKDPPGSETRTKSAAEDGGAHLDSFWYRISHERPTFPTVAGFAVVVAIVTFLWRFVTTSDTTWLGVLWIDTLPAHIAFFAVGVVAARRGWSPRISGRAGFIGAIAGGAASIAGLFLYWTGGALEGPTWQSFAYATWQQILAIGWTCTLLAFCGRFLDMDVPITRWIEDNAYAVFCVHAPVTVLVAQSLNGITAGGALGKFALVVVISFPICWLVATALRLIPGVKRVL